MNERIQEGENLREAPGMTERSKGQRGIIMSRELSQTQIKEFIATNGLDLDLLDEREETLEAWRLKWEGLAKGFMNYLQDRFTAIEHRIGRLEQLVEERYGYHGDEGPSEDLPTSLPNAITKQQTPPEVKGRFLDTI
jgi:hypothetical protein